MAREQRLSGNRLKDKKSKLSVRRSQMITTYGIGSLVPSDSESFVVMGQEFWRINFSDDESIIHEPALQKILRVGEFRNPPDGGRFRVSIKRFPEVVQCPSCGALGRFWELARKNPKGDYVNECRRCSATKKVALAPSRFIAVCPHGHMEDFPYFRWVHKGTDSSGKAGHQLSISNDPGSESLAGMTIQCSCGASRSMEGALGQYSLNERCNGERPWLEEPDKVECNQKLKGLQRGSTSVWSPIMRSAIAIDRDLTELETEIINSQKLLLGSEAKKRDRCIRDLAEDFDVSEEEVRDLTRKHLSEDLDIASLEVALRQDEYRAFLTEHEELEGTESFVCHPVDLINEYSMGHHLLTSAKIPRMREVRVLCGFTRGGGPEGDNREMNRGLLAQEPQSWLPAIEVFGEGIFIGFDEAKVNEWANTDFARSRTDLLVNTADSGYSVEDFDPRSLMLHTFAHVMINQLALNTGYPASSIRERVYAEGDQAGVFLYTATADSAGSLGGLCAQADPDRLNESILSAIDTARWCSAESVRKFVCEALI